LKWPALVALILGLVAVAGLFASSDLGEIGRALTTAGWGVLVVIAAHGPSVVATTLGWRAVIDSPTTPPFLSLLKLRWIKESVNSLLPVAQVGGDLVRARLLIHRGVSLRAAAAGCTVDVAAGTVSLFLYLLMGLAFLLVSPHERAFAEVAQRSIAVAGVIAVALALAPRLGLFRLVENAVTRFGEERAWKGLGDLTGLHEAVVAIYRQPRRLWSCGLWHLVAWMLGTIETYAGLWALGLQPTLAQAFIIDSLGQGIRAAGFAVPGALGVQEGGYILVGSLFGIPGEQMLAFSTIRRIREVALGVPGLFAWGRKETKKTPPRLP
jgi:putative membrane protein